MRKEDLDKKFNELNKTDQYLLDLNNVMYLFSELITILGEKYKIEDELNDLIEKYSTSFYRALLDPHYKGGWAYTRDYKNQIIELIKKAK